MARAYSQDLRDRVIDAVESEGLSRRAAARRFGVSAAAAIKWLQRFQRTGKRGSAGTGGHRPSKIQPHRAWVVAVVAAQPDSTLAALAARLWTEPCAGRHPLRKVFHRRPVLKKSLVATEQDRPDIQAQLDPRRLSWMRPGQDQHAPFMAAGPGASGCEQPARTGTGTR